MKNALNVPNDDLSLLNEDFASGVTPSERVTPLSQEEYAVIYNESHTDSKMSVDYLTIEQIKERYSLTDHEARTLMDMFPKSKEEKEERQRIMERQELLQFMRETVQKSDITKKLRENLNSSSNSGKSGESTQK